jgi:type I restriction enzyme S subunit
VNNINSEEVQALHFQLPPLPEQQVIVRRVENLFALADQLEARLTAAQQQVDALTPSLLAHAFRGQLVLQDPADEPASTLLERIKAKRMANNPHLAGRSPVRTMALRAKKRPPRQ